jgi:hypothetical protein
MAAQAFLRRGIQQSMAAKIVDLGVARCGIVRVTSTDEPELVWIVAARILHRETVRIGFANVTAMQPRRALDTTQEILKIS